MGSRREWGIGMGEAVGTGEMKGVAAEVVCDRFSEEGWVRTSVHVPSEMEITLYINRQELVTILCTPTKLNFLVLGFLYGQGMIADLDDVVVMRICDDEPVADVRLRNSEYVLPTKRTITPGCGGGAIFQVPDQKVETDLTVQPMEVLALMKQFLDKMDLYKYSGGVHTSALANRSELLIVAEDIGRHNTLDKIQGECLIREIVTKDLLLLTTGRISSEMLFKAVAMQVPIVVSRHSPTERSVSLALDLGITLVGHARGGRLMVYSYPERLGFTVR